MQAVTPALGVNSSYLSGPLPSVLSPSATSPRMFQGPSIREVQIAVASLREASLCVVEAVQAWRRERQKELDRRKREDGTTRPQSAEVPRGANGGGEASPSSWSPAGPEYDSGSKYGQMTEGRVSPEVRFPVVPTAQPVLARGEDLPIFWWSPPAAGKPQPESSTTQAPRRTSLGPETSVPEQVGHDLNEGPVGPAAATPKRHRHSDGATGNSAPSPAGNANVDPSGNDQASTSLRPSPARAEFGVNYLARMATDTDFVGAPGSVLVDFFPPDTKLYRNPFVLGHNLDDTLAVFPGNAAASPRDRGRQDTGDDGRSSTAVAKNGRLDTRRVRLASAAIVAEDARERSGKRRRAGERGDQDAPSGAAGNSCEGGSPSGRHDGQRFDRPDSGGSRSGEDDHGGSGSSPKKRRGKGGIRFQDEHSEGKGRRCMWSHRWAPCACLLVSFVDLRWQARSGAPERGTWRQRLTVASKGLATVASPFATDIHGLRSVF